MDTEFFTNIVGDSIVITPKDCLQTVFMQGMLMITDDFMKSGRPEETIETEKSLTLIS